MNILFLSGWFPYPSDNGSKLRISNLLQSLASKHEITLLSFIDKPDGMIDTTTAKNFCREVQVVPQNSNHRANRDARFSFLSSTPRSIAKNFSPQMEQHIRQTLSAKSYDLVIASQLGTASYAYLFGELPALFEEAEVGVLYQQFALATSPARKLRYGLTWQKHRRYVARLLQRFRACTVVSERERELLKRCAPQFQNVRLVPNCIRLDEYRAPHAAIPSRTLIFTGSFRYFANYEAMVWFLNHVYSRIQARVPDVRLIITGDTANLQLPPANNVVCTGNVDDVRALIAASAISLAPLQVGGGTRLKILEAMALRTPVVATSKGAEGLEVRHGQHLLIADTPEEFACGVIRLLTESDLHQRLTENAYELVRAKYDCSIVMPQFLDWVDRVAHN